MKDSMEYRYSKGVTIPAERRGRRKSVNFDEYIVAKALHGLETGRYKNYSDAARKLARRARTFVNGIPTKVASYESNVDRLRRLPLPPTFVVKVDCFRKAHEEEHHATHREDTNCIVYVFRVA